MHFLASIWITKSNKLTVSTFILLVRTLILLAKNCDGLFYSGEYIGNSLRRTAQTSYIQNNNVSIPLDLRQTGIIINNEQYMNTLTRR